MEEANDGLGESLANMAGDEGRFKTELTKIGPGIEFIHISSSTCRTFRGDILIVYMSNMHNMQYVQMQYAQMQYEQNTICTKYNMHKIQ